MASFYETCSLFYNRIEDYDDKAYFLADCSNNALFYVSPLYFSPSLHANLKMRHPVPSPLKSSIESAISTFQQYSLILIILCKLGSEPLSAFFIYLRFNRDQSTDIVDIRGYSCFFNLHSSITK